MFSPGLLGSSFNDGAVASTKSGALGHVLFKFDMDVPLWHGQDQCECHGRPFATEGAHCEPDGVQDVLLATCCFRKIWHHDLGATSQFMNAKAPAQAGASVSQHVPHASVYGLIWFPLSEAGYPAEQRDAGHASDQATHDPGAASES